MAAALGRWFWQEVQYFGTAAEAFASMTQAVTSRVSVSDNAVRTVTIPEVLHLYFVENKEPLLQFGPVTITLLPLLADGSEVLWLWGCGFAEGCAPDEYTHEVLTVRTEKTGEA